jgi:hypothetical protein
MAIISNLVIDQGSTFQADIDVTDASGDALVLTAYQQTNGVRGQLRKTYQSTTAVDFSASVYSATSGTVRIGLSATATNALKAGRYVYDVEIEHGTTGEVTRIVEGQIEVTPGVTRG